VFATEEATGKLQAAWLIKEQLRTLMAAVSLAAEAAAKDHLEVLGGTVHSAGNESALARYLPMVEVLTLAGATSAKVEANNTVIKHINRT